ncbi:hypothetical protein FHK92_25855 [Pseudomonas brassicacearum subsp. neoaurantiaca]|uniref:Uncharacterized protein n=2 Tax=Pseudomonas brassicacearum TaxID=930166 RepID=A0A7V8UGI3_9PSED|nr:hypothetical protein [Pseudomonas brassicacearum subsp. neoaurantiaca]
MIRREKRLVAAVMAILAACTVLFFFPVDSVVENPGDLNDTYGLPPVSIYLVVLIILTVTSMVLTGLGSIARKVLKHGSFRLHVGLYVFFNAPLVLTSLLGMLVSVAYMYDSISGILAALLFLCSFVGGLLAVPHKAN